PSCPVPAPQCLGCRVPEGPHPIPAPHHPHSSWDPQSQRSPSSPAPGCVSESHTWQNVVGCDILEDGAISGYDQYGYDGRDFITFDMDTMT
ncbi:HMR1 protein, partial [Penelope pileata]|nr:HMR1 protein [Penelope pileata]